MKKLLSVILIVMMTIAIFACSNRKSVTNAEITTETQSTEKVTEQIVSEKPKVGISMPNTISARWVADGEKLKKGFEQKGYEVYLTDSDNSVDKQIRDIENFISNDVKLLVVSSVDSTALTNVLSSAKEKNIPVISYDRFIMNSDAVSYYVSYDNYFAGKLQGEFVEKQLDLKNTTEKFNIEFFSGDLHDTNALSLFNGAYDVLKPYIEKGILTIPSGQIDFKDTITNLWLTSSAMDRMKSILETNYANGEKLDAVVCSADSIAIGVTHAIESNYTGNNQVIITGEDGAEANLKNIIDGKQSMTAFKAIPNEVTVAVELGDLLIKGEKPNESLISNSNWNFDCIYDSSSFNNEIKDVPSYILSPIAITKDNIQSELIDTGYYHMENGYPKSN